MLLLFFAYGDRQNNAKEEVVDLPFAAAADDEIIQCGLEAPTTFAEIIIIAKNRALRIMMRSILLGWRRRE